MKIRSKANVGFWLGAGVLIYSLVALAGPHCVIIKFMATNSTKYRQ